MEGPELKKEAPSRSPGSGYRSVSGGSLASDKLEFMEDAATMEQENISRFTHYQRLQSASRAA